MDSLHIAALTIARSVVHGGRIDDDARLILSLFEQGADSSNPSQEHVPCGRSDVGVIRRLFDGEVIGVTGDGSLIETLAGGIVGESEGA